MAHTIHDKKRLTTRINRIIGQLQAIGREIEAEKECDDILMTLASCRGAINGLMGELIEGHVRHHVIDPDHRPSKNQLKAVDQLLAVVKTYLR